MIYPKPHLQFTRLKPSKTIPPIGVAMACGSTNAYNKLAVAYELNSVSCTQSIDFLKIVGAGFTSMNNTKKLNCAKEQH